MENNYNKQSLEKKFNKICFLNELCEASEAVLFTIFEKKLLKKLKNNYFFFDK